MQVISSAHQQCKIQELMALPSFRDQPRSTKPFRQHDLEEQVRLKADFLAVR
jgi:hypothetical protein